MMATVNRLTRVHIAAVVPLTTDRTVKLAFDSLQFITKSDLESLTTLYHMDLFTLCGLIPNHKKIPMLTQCLPSALENIDGYAFRSAV